MTPCQNLLAVDTAVQQEDQLHSLQPKDSKADAEGFGTDFQGEKRGSELKRAAEEELSSGSRSRQDAESMAQNSCNTEYNSNS